MGLRRWWRDVRLRRPPFELVRGPGGPVRYRGRPFPLAELPVGDELRLRLQRWAEGAGAGDEAKALATEVGEAIDAPVVVDGAVATRGRRPL